MKTFFSFISIFVILVFLTGCSKAPGKYNTFAQCLTEKGVKMYGTEWCSHCKNQKRAFGSSFDYIDYIDCDKNRDECLIAGIEGYPTWVINEEKYPGEQSLQRLAALSGCNLIVDE